MSRKRSTYYIPANYVGRGKISGNDTVSELETNVSNEIIELWGIIQILSDKIDQLEKILIDENVIVNYTHSRT